MNKHRGTFTIEPLSAELTRDTDTFSKMDPYVEIKVGNQKPNKTQPHQGGGKNPKWNGYQWTWQIMNEQDMVVIRVYDEDATTSDHIGTSEPFRPSKFGAYP